MTTDNTPELHKPQHPVRFVTAASLFDGHDAAINIMRRILQAQGAEVIHLGHNRSVDDVVTAAIQEDANGVAISSYQGGHIEYFTYLVERLRAAGRPDIKVYGGGGGVIVADEIEHLHSVGVARIFSPEDGQRLGLAGMINTMIAACDTDPATRSSFAVDALLSGSQQSFATAITAIEAGTIDAGSLAAIRTAAAGVTAPVLGITGTGGPGKSSLTDELLRRFRLDQEDKLHIAVIAVDPTRRRGGGALLGDRIRMNAIDSGQIYFRSLATRTATTEVPPCLPDVIAACRAAGYDMIIVETPGIGQGDAAIVEYSDVSLYVMTPEFGAASQLEKIDMLDFADAIAIDKFERRGAEDALRDVRRQMVRNKESFSTPAEDMPVFGTIAARFNDEGVTALYQYLRSMLSAKGLTVSEGMLPVVSTKTSKIAAAIVPPARGRYLAELAETVRAYHRTTAEQAGVARQLQQLADVRAMLTATGADTSAVEKLHASTLLKLDAATHDLLEAWPARAEAMRADQQVEANGRVTSLV